MTRVVRQRICICIFGVCLLGLSGVALSETFETRGYPARISPGSPAFAQPTYLVMERWVCTDVLLLGVTSHAPSKTISVALSSFSPDFSPCPPYDFPRLPLRVLLPGIQEEGIFTLNVYFQSQPAPGIYDPVNLATSREFVVSGTPEHWFETPEQGSTQSGVGLVRGWVCDADSVQIQFDELPVLNAGYGATRADTMDICGDDNNGYGLAYAWGLLGEGEHRMKTYIDDEIVSDVGFSVTSLGEPFVTGLSGGVEVQDFPAPGESVLLQWSEAAQNFIIVEYLSEPAD